MNSFRRANSFPRPFGRSQFFFVMIIWLGVPVFTQGQPPPKQGPDNEKFRQATEAFRLGHLDEAAEGFAAVAAASPTFAQAHFNLGLVREEQGRNEDAVASLQRALKLMPKLRGANLFLGIAEYRLNHLDRAVAAFRRETSLAPTDANTWMWLGVAQLAKEQPEEAVVSLDRAAKLAPDNVDVLYHRGRAHLLVSKNSYEQMFKTDPKSSRVHQVLAQADAEADRHEDAIAEYKAAIDLAPRQPGLHEELGTEYWKVGKLELAESELQREIEIDPNNVLAQFKLGTLEVERGEGAKSKELLESALKRNSSLKNAAYYLGRAEMELGNNEAAADAFNREIAAPAADPEIVQQSWYQLGIVYRRLHRTEDAQKALIVFQKLKDESNQRLHERFEKKQGKQEPDATPN